MMLLLLIYCYATGRFSSRRIEDATWSDVIVRYICGGELHPDHDTICTFRRNNGKLFERSFSDLEKTPAITLPGVDATIKEQRNGRWSA